MLKKSVVLRRWQTWIAPTFSIPPYPKLFFCFKIVSIYMTEKEREGRRERA